MLLMKLLKGRSEDFILLPDGRKLSPLGILDWNNFPEVMEFRIIQERRNLIEIWLRMHENYDKNSVTRYISALQRVLGDKIEIRPRIVAAIPRDKTGKLRRFISKIVD